jgi:hypothetical protein
MIDTLEYSVDAPIRSVEEPAFVHARYWIDVTRTCELSGNPVFFLGAIRYALRQGWSMIAVARDLFLVLVARRLDLHLARTVPELVLPLVTERRPDEAETDDHQDAQNGPRAHRITSAETLSAAKGIAPVR